MDALQCIQTAPLCQQQNIVKQWFINKSSKQFASVSRASVPDSCAFYRVVINQRGLVNEKEGHNMQISPLDLPMHNGKKKKKFKKMMALRKGLFFSAGVHICTRVSG